MRILVVLITLCSAAYQVHADDKIDVANAVERAKAIVKAVTDKDYAKVVDATYPAVIEIAGGREKMIDAINVAMKRLKDRGFKIASEKIGKPATPVIDGKTAYVVIPTTMEMTTPDATIVTESYLLGITTNGGKSWAFVDGAGLSQPKLKEKIFPKLPKELKLPECKPPRITKKAKEKDRQ